MTTLGEIVQVTTVVGTTTDVDPMDDLINQFLTPYEGMSWYDVYLKDIDAVQPVTQQVQPEVQPTVQQVKKVQPIKRTSQVKKVQQTKKTVKKPVVTKQEDDWTKVLKKTEKTEKKQVDPRAKCGCGKPKALLANTCSECSVKCPMCPRFKQPQYQYCGVCSHTCPVCKKNPKNMSQPACLICMRKPEMICQTRQTIPESYAQHR